MKDIVVFKEWNDLMKHLESIDNAQCFSVNYCPQTKEYELSINTKSHYSSKVITLREKSKFKSKSEDKMKSREMLKFEIEIQTLFDNGNLNSY